MFVAVYQPVQTLAVAIMASVALGEEFYLGGSALFLHLNLSQLLTYICTTGYMIISLHFTNLNN